MNVNIFFVTNTQGSYLGYVNNCGLGIIVSGNVTRNEIY